MLLLAMTKSSHLKLYIMMSLLFLFVSSTAILAMYLPFIITTILLLIIMHKSALNSDLLIELAPTLIIINLAFLLTNNYFSYNAPLFVIATIILGYYTNRKLLTVLSTIIVSLFIYLSFLYGLNIIDIILITYACLNLIINFLLLPRYVNTPNKIAIISSDVERDAVIIKVLKSQLKLEKREYQIIDNQNLSDEYNSVILINDFRFNYKDDRIKYNNLKGKNILLLFRSSLFDDAVSLIPIIKIILYGGIFMGRLDIRRFYKHISDQPIRDAVINFANGYRAGVPPILYFTPSILINIFKAR